MFAATDIEDTRMPHGQSVIRSRDRAKAPTSGRNQSERREKWLLEPDENKSERLKSMKNQIEIVPGVFLDRIPEPNDQVRRLMLATAMLIDGFLDESPEHFHPSLHNTFLAPQAGIIIAGTRCPRPLLTREIVNVAKAVERDAIVVRLGDEHGGRETFDIHQYGNPAMMMRYCLWMPQPTGAAWLIPTAGEDAFVRFDPHGFDVTDRPPFADCYDRHRGMVWASEFLSVANKGWF